MNFFDKLKAQVNMNDGGRTFNSPQGNQPQLPQRQNAQPTQTSYTPAQREQMTPVGQTIPQDFMDSFSSQTRALADIYNQNPRDPRVSRLDPKMFGYRPDDGSLRVQQNPGMQIGGQFQEDSYTPTAALENTGYYNPQTTRHGGILVNQQLDQLRKLLGY